MMVLAFMPAVGGGSLRDLLLGAPVFWLNDTSYLALVLGATLICFFGFRHVSNATRLLDWADAAGLAVFSVLGCAKAMSYDVAPAVAVMMGVVTAVAGGLIRDVVANDIPHILQREIYATAALAGALAYWLLAQTDLPFAIWIAIAVAFGIRALGIVRGLSLPRVKQ